jgi:hypothetical protein
MKEEIEVAFRKLIEQKWKDAWGRLGEGVGANGL